MLTHWGAARVVHIHRHKGGAKGTIVINHLTLKEKNTITRVSHAGQESLTRARKGIQSFH